MNEFQINTSVLMVPYNGYMNQAGLFLNHFTPGTNAFSASQRVPVNYSSLEAERDTLDPTGRTALTYLTGFRVCFGLVNDEVALYFVPVFADLLRQSGNNTDFAIEENSGDLAAIIDSGNYSVYQSVSGTLTSVMGSDAEKNAAKQAVNDYTGTILIMRQDGSQEHYVSGEDSKAVFIPFQEIQALHSAYSASTIYFSSVAEMSNGEYRHSVTMSHLDPRNNPSFSGNAANMVTLCPPNCQQVMFLSV